MSLVDSGMLASPLPLSLGLADLSYLGSGSGSIDEYDIRVLGGIGGMKLPLLHLPIQESAEDIEIESEKEKDTDEFITEQEERLDAAQPVDSSWKHFYDKYVAHQAKHKNEDPPAGCLLRWVMVQREAIAAGRMDAYKQKLLLEAGFVVRQVADPSAGQEANKKWDFFLSKLVAYKEQYGDFDVPFSCVGYKGLGEWVCMQRLYRDEGYDFVLTQERAARLDDIGFTWRSKLVEGHRQQAVPWDQRFRELAGFKAAHGHLNVPPDHKGYAQLAVFVKKMRHAKAASRLSDAKVKLLQDLGFDWEQPMEKAWEDKYNELSSLKSAQGHVDVAETNPKLREWLKFQRKLQQTGKLKEDRRRRLESLGISWDPKPRNTAVSGSHQKSRAAQQKQMLLSSPHPEAPCMQPSDVNSESSSPHRDVLLASHAHEIHSGGSSPQQDVLAASRASDLNSGGSSPYQEFMSAPCGQDLNSAESSPNPDFFSGSPEYEYEVYDLAQCEDETSSNTNGDACLAVQQELLYCDKSMSGDATGRGSKKRKQPCHAGVQGGAKRGLVKSTSFESISEDAYAAEEKWDTESDNE